MSHQPLVEPRARQQIYGLEVDDQLARQAQERLKSYPNVVVVSGNGLDHLPRDGTVFWSFNPFEWDGPGEAMMRDFSSQLHDFGRENIRVVLFRTHH
jgi:hypothetical protein